MNRARQAGWRSGAIAGALILVFATMFAHAQIKPDETVVFFPTVATWSERSNVWQCEIKGMVFEEERRRPQVAALRKALSLSDVKMTAAEEALFSERMRAFMADNERGKEIKIRLGDTVFPLGKSGANGHFSGKVSFTQEQANPALKDGQVKYAMQLRAGDQRPFGGHIWLGKAEGISIISDIDDTIKISEVRDKRKLLANTFYRPFEPAPGMAELYQRWAQTLGADVHYVSASPWQLFGALEDFNRTNGFPAGAIYLRQLRVKDRSFLSLFGDPVTYKLSVIEPLLKRFPKRRFILAGDSGEKDPEVYGTIARRYPEMIQKIYIRDVTGEASVDERYREAFKGLPETLWQVFKETKEIR